MHGEQCHGWPSTQPDTFTQPCPIVHTAVPPLFTQPCPGRTMSTVVCFLCCRAVCKLPGCVEGHPWMYHQLQQSKLNWSKQLNLIKCLPSFRSNSSYAVYTPKTNENTLCKYFSNCHYVMYKDYIKTVPQVKHVNRLMHDQLLTCHWRSFFRHLHRNLRLVRIHAWPAIDLLPDTQTGGLCMRQECRERFPRLPLQRQLLVSDPGMHHGTCHTPWCMSGSLTRGGGEILPPFPPHSQLAILLIL